ncbi:MAG: hypothetical protein Q9227_009395 [Pyrenula ochraceoflavens]
MLSQISFICLTLGNFSNVLAYPPSSLSSRSTTIYTSLGDSYASGNGAGVPIRPLCGSYSLAYPVHLAQTFSLTPVSAEFHNVACGGATTWSVQSHQLASVSESDVVTLTVGGNEVDFFSTLNECVYYWWEGSGCEVAMEETRTLIESGALLDRYLDLVQEIVKRLKPSGKLLVTGYARFFSEETEACDNSTFSRRRPDKKLTKELRTDMNHLVRLLNVVIEGAAKAGGAEYVDIDLPYEGHRFCEAGVEEPNLERIETWFYNLQPDKSAETSLMRFFEREYSHYHEQQVVGSMASSFEELTRVFHPTPEGHEGIAKAILKQLRAAKG